MLLLQTLKSSTSTPFEFFIPQIKFDNMQVKIAVTDLETGECEDYSISEENTPATK